MAENITAEEQLRQQAKSLGEPVLSLITKILEKHHHAIVTELREQVSQMLADQRDLREALKAVVFAARTSGGVAGRDDALCAACELAERVLEKT